MAYDADSASVIKLSNNSILYLREVNKHLALVCLMRAEYWQASGLIEYNFSCFRDAIARLFEAKNKMANSKSAAVAAAAAAAAAGGAGQGADPKPSKQLSSGGVNASTAAAASNANMQQHGK
jgi:Ras-related GTP-binding protein C/D